MTLTRASGWRGSGAFAAEFVPKKGKLGLRCAAPSPRKPAPGQSEVVPAAPSPEGAGLAKGNPAGQPRTRKVTRTKNVCWVSASVAFQAMVVVAGVEPAPARLAVSCSTSLSYTAWVWMSHPRPVFPALAYVGRQRLRAPGGVRSLTARVRSNKVGSRGLRSGRRFAPPGTSGLRSSVALAQQYFKVAQHSKRQAAQPNAIAIEIAPWNFR